MHPRTPLWSRTRNEIFTYTLQHNVRGVTLVTFQKWFFGSRKLLSWIEFYAYQPNRHGRRRSSIHSLVLYMHLYIPYSLYDIVEEGCHVCHTRNEITPSCTQLPAA